jgi:hypothetical protein
MQTIITNLKGIVCGDHYADLINVGVRVPAGVFPMTIEGGTDLKLSQIEHCPHCGNKFNLIVLAEDWLIYFEEDPPVLALAPGAGELAPAAAANPAGGAPASLVVYEPPDDLYGDPAFGPGAAGDDFTQLTLGGF